MLKICPTEMIAIQDSINGVISAKKADSKVIVFLTSFDKEILKETDYFAEDYIKVEKIIIKKPDKYLKLAFIQIIRKISY